MSETMQQLVMMDLLLHGDIENEVFDDPRDYTPMDMVKQYQKTVGQHPDPALYANLIGEEYEEWARSWAMGPTPHQLKELADMVYVIYGYANSRGWNLDEALRRVHDNNMGRMFQEDGTIERRKDGKIIKNDKYPKVDLHDLVQ